MCIRPWLKQAHFIYFLKTQSHEQDHDLCKIVVFLDTFRLNHGLLLIKFCLFIDIRSFLNNYILFLTRVMVIDKCLKMLYPRKPIVLHAVNQGHVSPGVGCSKHHLPNNVVKMSTC